GERTYLAARRSDLWARLLAGCGGLDYRAGSFANQSGGRWVSPVGQPHARNGWRAGGVRSDRPDRAFLPGRASSCQERRDCARQHDVGAVTASVRQSEQRAQWLTDLGDVGRRVGEVAGSLNRRQLDWSPPEGSWGVGQVLEHLCLANDSYIERIQAALHHARPRLPTA